MHIEASSEIASSAIRSLRFDAFSYAVFAPSLVYFDLSDDWAFVLCVALVWLAVFLLLDRWRLGADYRAVRKAEVHFIWSFGTGSYFVGFGCTITVFFLLGVHDNIGIVLLAGYAGGKLSQALWISHKLKRQHSIAPGR